jgi:hypothetical protein
VTATYFGFQLRDQGFFVYPQVQCSGSIKNHLDIAAINPASGTVLSVEAKRLYSSEPARSLGQGWRRLQTTTITSELRHNPHGYCCFYCLLVTTWNERIHDWWMDADRAAAPGRCNADDWADLADAFGCASLDLGLNVTLDRLGWSDKLHLLFSFIRP